MYNYRVLGGTVETSGGHLQAFAKSFPPMTQEIAWRILASKGMGDPDPDIWYPLQPLLDAMKEISDQLGAAMLRRVGFQVIQEVPLPPWTSLEDAFGGLDHGYQMNHRGGIIGSYTCDVLPPGEGINRIRMVVRTHWPCKYEQGILEGVGHRFRPVGVMDVLVRKDEQAPCRMTGGDSCTFIVSWC